MAEAARMGGASEGQIERGACGATSAMVVAEAVGRCGAVGSSKAQPVRRRVATQRQGKMIFGIRVTCLQITLEQD
jgi:hypothetical protein